MRGREEAVSAALHEPEEIRRSRWDETVLLFYRPSGPSRWVCAVVKLADMGGFLITSYPTAAIKAGELL